jgi:hypothetical protein
MSLQKAKQDVVCIDWNMVSESHEGIFSNQKEGMQDNFLDDVTATLSDFLSYLAKNGAVDPHIECHTHQTQFTKNDQDEVIVCSVNISNTETCTLAVKKRVAKVSVEFDRVGSEHLIGSDAAFWDYSARAHNNGVLEN